PVAGPDGGHGAPRLDDLADRLVTEHGAGRHLGHVAPEDVQVGPADGHGGDPDDGVGGVPQARVGDLFPRGPSGAMEDVTLHAAPRFRGGPAGPGAWPVSALSPACPTRG